MKYAIALLTLASFGTMFAADKPATDDTKMAKKHSKKHGKKKAAADTTAPATK